MPLRPCESPDESTTIIQEMFSRTVRRVGNVVMKSGQDVSFDESEALKIAYAHKLPVPEVYETHKKAEGHVCIRMQYIEGTCLHDAWKDMTVEQKTIIAAELRQTLFLMKKIQSPTSAISSCSGGPLTDCRRYTTYDGGPFTSEEDFNAFVLDLFSATPSVLKKTLSRRLPTSSKIVFTHGDLSRRNIMVHQGHVSGIVDWEFAGWFPEHWDYLKFFEKGVDSTDWKEYGDLIFPRTYEDLLADYQAIIRWQKP